MAALTMILRADTARFKAKIAWMASLLESRDIFERVDSGLLGRLQNAVSGRPSEELVKIADVPARVADELILSVDDGPIIVELEAALGTLGFKFHDEAFVVVRPALAALVSEWERSARNQFECAGRTEEPIGKRAMEHGAMVYFNCAQALRRVLDASLPQSSSTPKQR